MEGGQYVNFAFSHWYYPLYLMDTRFFYRLFSRSNSLDNTRRCGHPRDYLVGAAINGPSLIPLEGVDEAGWQSPAKCDRP